MKQSMGGSGVSVFASSTLSPLIDALATRLDEPVSDPFASELVVVPNVGVRDWLQRELCTRLGGGEAGIVANIRFMFVQQFLDTVFEASGSTSVENWRIDRLMWSVHRAIDLIGRESIPGAVKSPLTVARVVADLFDRYGVHRPSMLRYWGHGRAVDAVEPLQDLPEHMAWQQRVYAEVSSGSEQGSPADRLAELGDRIRERGLDDSVPMRVSLFGFVTVNATVRSVIDAVGAARSVQLYLLHPSHTGEPAGDAVSDRLVVRDHSSIDQSGNPLLARWARPAFETRDVLSGPWVRFDGADSSAVTCLERLQQSIVANRSLDLISLDEKNSPLDRGDGSLQVHACHGRVRQVEVLRDAILHLLHDDVTLTLGDISIQCPDLVSYAPIIGAIFGSGRTSSGPGVPPLDVTIADRVLSGENPYLDAFWSLLDLARARCGVGEMMTILSAPPIRRRFDIDDDVLGRASDWFESLGVKFGLDVEHRLGWGVPSAVEGGTWDDALDRLFMGLAVPADDPFEGPGGIVPFDDISVTEAPKLARIAEFLVQVRHLVSHLERPHTIREWSRILTAVVFDFFDESNTRDFACRGLLDSIDQLHAGADAAGVSTSDLFSFDEVVTLVSDTVSAAGSRPRFRSGAITVTELLPQQGVPYRVIALLGASETMFASGGVHGDDVLGLRPCIGDPMPTASGRLQLLNIVLAAQDALIITCDGADISNNKDVPLPVPVQEMLEAMAGILSESDPDHEIPIPTEDICRVLIRHPRQSFSPRALETGLLHVDRPFTFDPVALEVHQRLSGTPTPVLSARVVQGSSKPLHLTASQLRRVLSKPSEFFVQDVLGIRLPSTDAGSGNDFIEFWPSFLEYSRAGRELLEGILRSTSESRNAATTIMKSLTLSGRFPPGRLGEMASEQVMSEVLSIVDLLPEQARRFENHTAVDIDDIVIPEFPAASSGTPSSTEGVISGVVGNIHGFDLIRPVFTKFRDDMMLDPWVDLALVTLALPEHPWSVRLVARGDAEQPIARRIHLVGGDESERSRSAHRVISTVLTLRRCLERGRISYLPRTAEKIFTSSLDAASTSYTDDATYSVATQFLFGRVSWEQFSSEEAFVDDPPGTSSKRASRYAHFVWNAFEATTEVATSAEVTS